MVRFKSIVGVCFAMVTTLGYGVEPTLKTVYQQHCREPSDIFEHLPPLRAIASECSSAIEIGVRSMVSTWGILQGLAESPSKDRTYLGIDLNYPTQETLHLADDLATQEGILFSFWKGNDMTMDLPEVDFLFIDSLHTYCHLTYELETFSRRARKYIALHDTSPPWELMDDHEYWGNYSEYPPHIDRTKRGLWAAVEDFLDTHPEWILHERRTNCHGLTVLKRIDPSVPRGPKILYTSALIPQHYEKRKQEYINSLEQIRRYGALPNTYVIESGPSTIFSFFEDHCDHVFYSGTNDTSVRNKGVNEANSLLNFCKSNRIGDDEMIVKLTGRYFFSDDTLLKYIDQHPDADAIVSFREEHYYNHCLQTGCFAIKGKYFKDWLQTMDLEKMEEKMIDIEWEFTDYIRKMIVEGANVEILERLGVTANVANEVYRYY